ncbi:hypothetical protein LSH36_358g02015 [Paralvinella palmiformis]|uniref:FRAS1-related extracellular matrix protein N-terminal domain-containing protein n=1 Tax=Paralvinella palmiformis TaxID=53620 RepID=A0AAD9JEP0_9ANNE|nr:hypothetical protein LSH36_358g02015 [Paralvinella palmiformis]
MGRRFNWIEFWLPLLLVVTSSSTMVQKRALIVERGRSTFLHPNDLAFDLEDGSLCQVQVVENEPTTQRVGSLHPKIPYQRCCRRFQPKRLLLIDLPSSVTELVTRWS